MSPSHHARQQCMDSSEECVSGLKPAEANARGGHAKRGSPLNRTGVTKNQPQHLDDNARNANNIQVKLIDSMLKASRQRVLH